MDLQSAQLADRVAAVSLNNAGVALAAEGKTDQAIARFREAITREADFAEAHVNLGIALERKADFAEVERCYARALAIEPLNSSAHLNWAIALEKQGKTAEAVRRYRLALDVRPDLHEALLRLGRALSTLQNWKESAAVLKQAVRGDPKNFHALYHWSIALQKTGQLCQAEKACRRALWLEDADARAAHRRTKQAVRPLRAKLLNELANVLLGLGRAEEAIDTFQQAVTADPANAGIHSNLIYAMHYSPATTPQRIFSESVEWGRRHACHDAEPAPETQSPSSVDISPRRLRIGYVAPDLRHHPSKFFLEPVLKHHDRSRFEVFVYAELNRDDDAKDIAPKAENWRPVGGLHDARVADLIRRDQIDLLIDIHGHSGWHRLGVFARKPAARQANWMGYPSTTGLPQIDWRITDEIVDPPGSEAFNTETLIRLPPPYMCYKPSEYSPPVNALPALANGYITFGCLNNPCKINPQVIQTWANALKVVPTSRLMVLFNGGDPERAATLQRFASLGIDTHRLIPIPRNPSRLHYLELYHRIDIAFDPFPYNGCTTSCDSLWMGVSIVTLSGDTTVSRVGKMLLENLGLRALAASTAEQYVQIAQQLATDLPQLAELRLGLRARMAASPLCDGQGFTRELEAAYQRVVAATSAP